MAATARIVQITDTHFSAAAGVPPQWPATVAWLRADPPDLVVHTGDVVLEDPDDDADWELAVQLLADVPEPRRSIPGNHDIGFYGEEHDRGRRLDAFRRRLGDDRFTCDLAGWRIVGCDAYLLGQADHDDWLRAVTSVVAPVLVFVHQPVEGDEPDGWEMPAAARHAFSAALAGADVRVVASGHRHCGGQLGRAVWAPSLTLIGEGAGPGFDPRRGIVEHVVSTDGQHRWRVVRPWDHDD